MKGKTARKPIVLIEDLETLKVMSDPLRMQILQLLDPEPQTVNSIADKLGLMSSRLYYHFNLLESRGLIEVVDTRTINNFIEKVYWTTAEDVDVEKDLLNFSSESGQENLVQMISSLLDAAREDYLRSIQARTVQLDQGSQFHPRDIIMVSTKKRLDDVTYQEFVKKLKALSEEFAALPDKTERDEEGHAFSFVCYLYPSYTYEENDNAERIA